MKKRVAILGSTGSIGKQTLEVIDKQSEYFAVEVLTANNNYKLLIKQAIKYQPNVVVIQNPDHYSIVKESLENYDIKIYAGKKSISQVLEMETIDMVMIGLVGTSAIEPILSALKYRKPIALANKESIVVAGEIISKSVSQNNGVIIPVDSEHSAIFQCLMGEYDNGIKKIILTASGGPFNNSNSKDIENATVEQALNHPNWSMGNKVSIDSATLMNKGLEAIEAHWFFNVDHSNIEVLIHPQSIIHSMVYFVDGSVKTQLSFPDMKIPIQFALSYPARLKSSYNELDLLKTGTLNFVKPDVKKFRNLALAFEALKKGGNMPCILNAANDVAVEAFLKKRINLQQIPDIVEKSMGSIGFISTPSLEDYFETEKQTRQKAIEFI